VKTSATTVLRQLADAAWRRRYLLAVPFLLMIPLSILGSWIVPKTYMARSLMLMQEHSSDALLSREGGAVDNLMREQRAAVLSALLKSERVLGRALRDIEGGALPADPKAVAGLQLELERRVSVDIIGADLLEFKLRDRSPKGLGAKLDMIATRFLESLLLPAQSTVSAPQMVIERRRAELDAAEKALASFNERAVEELRDGSSRAAGLLELRQRLVAATDALALARAQIESTRRQLGSDIAAWAAPEREVQRLRAEIAALQADPRGPPGRLAESQLRLQRLELLLESERARVGLQREVEQLAAAIEAQERQLSDPANKDRQRQQLERAVLEARELLQSYVARYAEAGGSSSLHILKAPERIKVIDAAKDPELPTLSRINIAFIGLLAGALLGLGLAVAAEIVDSTVRRSEEVTEITGAPILARLVRLDMAPPVDARDGTARGRLPMVSTDARRSDA
jgi:uncharacterized protein involved in exopolysaccharide biosynthesis